jgi:hypothetical protein
MTAAGRARRAQVSYAQTIALPVMTRLQLHGLTATHRMAVLTIWHQFHQYGGFQQIVCG